jgi:hypothetical protein
MKLSFSDLRQPSPVFDRAYVAHSGPELLSYMPENEKGIALVHALLLDGVAVVERHGSHSEALGLPLASGVGLARK